jgi:hypothetical protein
LTEREVRQLYQFDVPTSQPSSQTSRQPSGQPSTHPTNTLHNGLLAYYSFNNANAQDSSGNSIHGTVVSAGSDVDRFGISNGAIALDGLSSYVYFPGNPFNFYNTLTIAFWVKGAATQVDAAVVFDKLHLSGGWTLYQTGSNTGKCTFSFQELNGNVRFEYPPTIALGSSSIWTHIVITKNGFLVSYYVNGALTGTVTFSGGSGRIKSSGNSPVILGAYNGGGTTNPSLLTRFFKGSFDDLYFYNRTLTDGEIRSLYRYDVPTSQPSSRPSMQPTLQPTSQPTSHPTPFIPAKTMDLKQDIIPGQGFSLTGGLVAADVGDFNGDGFDDAVFIANWLAGTAYVLYGGHYSDVVVPLYSVTTLPINTGFSFSGFVPNAVGGGGVDFNKDGFADVIIGSGESPTPARNGITYVLFGNTTRKSLTIDAFNNNNNNGLLGFRIFGAAAGDNCGLGVSGLGDFNKDTYGDIITCAPFANAGSGICYIIYGKKENITDIYLANLVPSVGFAILGYGSGQLGYSVSSVGDFNKDGFTDVIIGAATWGGTPGRAYLLYGTNETLTSLNLNSGFTKARGFFMNHGNGVALGKSVSSAGDFNHDGYDDFLVSAPKENSNTGVVYIFFGAKNKKNSFGDLFTQPPTANGGLVVYGESPGDQLGIYVSGNIDLNQDGIADIILATNRADAQTRCYVLYGQSEPFLAPIYLNKLSVRQGFTIYASTNVMSSSGFGVSGLGDINQDGYNDAYVWLTYSGFDYTGYFLYNVMSPTASPTGQPSSQPSRQPIRRPSSQPTRVPTAQPSRQPSRQPSSQPSCRPIRQPSSRPTRVPTAQPSRMP